MGRMKVICDLIKNGIVDGSRCGHCEHLILHEISYYCVEDMCDRMKISCKCVQNQTEWEE